MKEIIKILEKKQNVFLTGGAGVGKSYTAKKIIQSFLADKKNVAKLASTGIAATAIYGRTLHSFLNIGLNSSLEELSLSKSFNIRSDLKKLISKLDLIVIDEVSMLSSGLMDILKLRLEQGGFCGALLVIGDFLQLAPVFKKDKILEYKKKYPLLDENEVFSYAFKSNAWKFFDFKIINFTKIYRTKDTKFIDLLNCIRKASLDNDNIKYLYSFFKAIPKDNDDFTYLFSKNYKVDNLNNEKLEKLGLVKYEFEAEINIFNKNIKEVEIDNFFKEARIQKNLILKKGAKVLFIKNTKKYFNGQRGEIVGIQKDSIKVLKENNELVEVIRESFSKSSLKISNENGKEVLVEEELFNIKQFPLSLAYAISIHKSQGMSILNLIVDIDDIFAPSQFYVAISRAIDPNRLILFSKSVNYIKHLIYCDKEALNFYKEVEYLHI